MTKKPLFGSSLRVNPADVLILSAPNSSQTFGWQFSLCNFTHVFFFSFFCSKVFLSALAQPKVNNDTCVDRKDSTSEPLVAKMRTTKELKIYITTFFGLLKTVGIKK